MSKNKEQMNKVENITNKEESVNLDEVSVEELEEQSGGRMAEDSLEADCGTHTDCGIYW